MSDTPDMEFDDEIEQSRSETRAAFENRALLYAYIYEEMADELGAERATELMKRAIHRRGLDVGRKYRPAAHSRDLAEVGRIFCEGSPCGGELFEPGIEEEGEERIVLRMTACPLIDAWKAAGLDVDEIEHLCEIAAAVDEGTFEGAGLDLTFLERLGQPGSERCLLELRLP
jgi:hypothetical protein